MLYISYYSNNSRSLCSLVLLQEFEGGSWEQPAGATEADEGKLWQVCYVLHII